jgi:hypothetical protein
LRLTPRHAAMRLFSSHIAASRSVMVLQLPYNPVRRVLAHVSVFSAPQLAALLDGIVHHV